MTPGANGNGRLGVQPIAPVLEPDRASHGFPSPMDRLLLLRPPRYETDPLWAENLPAVLTPQGAREGIVVVWEIASAEGRPVLPLDTRALLRRRPATLDLLITYRSPSVSSDHIAGDVAEAATSAFRPIAVHRGHLNGHTANVRQLLTYPPRSLATEIVELLIYRGLVMNSIHQQIAVGVLRDVLTVEDHFGPKLDHDYGEWEVRCMFAHAGLPAPERWMRLGKALDFVFAYFSGDYTLEAAANSIGELTPYAVLRDLRDLTGIHADELVLRLGWRWVLEAWIQKEVADGGLSDDQADRLAMMGRTVRCRECGAIETHDGWAEA